VLVLLASNPLTATMPKETKAEWEARHLARTIAMGATERAAIQLHRPDLANLPWPQIEQAKPSRPYWFQRIVWDCQADARRHAHGAANRHDDGPSYDAAYIDSYAEAFPRLLAKALAKHDADPAAD
jgi:hypothetical protein